MILPLIAFLLLYVGLLGVPGDTKAEQHTSYSAFLLAAALWGVLILAITEGLSMFSAISQFWVGLAWGIIDAAMLALGLWKNWLREGLKRLRAVRLAGNPFELVLWMAVVGVFLVLLAVAWISPTNNVDTMQYHMPRVLQWAQNQNLGHFAAIYDNQNTRPYWAELGILNFRTLWGTDEPASFMQIFGLVGMMLGSAGVLSLFGRDRLAKWVSAVYLLTIPMGILQSTTPKNDLVVGFWTISLLYFVILSKKRTLKPLEWTGLGFSLGLGMLTKGTFLPFGLPIMIWFMIPRVFRQSWRRTLGEVSFLGILVLSINGAFWIRNFQTYGGPFGSSIPLHIPIISNLSESDGDPWLRPGANQPVKESIEPDQLLSADRISESQNQSRGSSIGITTPMVLNPGSTGIIGRQIGKLVRMGAMNLITPVSVVNEAIFSILSRFPVLFPESFIDSLRGAVWNYAMTAGNPLHFFLAVAALIASLVRMFERSFDLASQLGLVSLGGYFLVSFGGCSAVIVCMRYQFPFFIMAGVLVGLVLPAPHTWLRQGFILTLLLYLMPYTLINNMRPVIGMKPWPTRIDSVFRERPATILYAHIPNYRDEHAWIAEQILEAGCSRVGLYLEAREIEYPFWWLLEAPQSGIRLQHMNSTDATKRYMDPAFQPCAVICTLCQGVKEIEGLPVVSDFGYVQYFAVRP